MSRYLVSFHVNATACSLHVVWPVRALAFRAIHYKQLLTGQNFLRSQQCINRHLHVKSYTQLQLRHQPCPSFPVARGIPPVTCRDRRQSDTAVSQLIRPELVHLLPPHCGIIINDTATTAFTLHLHTVHVIAKASIANSHSSRDESIHRLALSPSLPTSPPLSLSSRFHHKKC